MAEWFRDVPSAVDGYFDEFRWSGRQRKVAEALYSILCRMSCLLFCISSGPQVTTIPRPILASFIDSWWHVHSFLCPLSAKVCLWCAFSPEESPVDDLSWFFNIFQRFLVCSFRNVWPTLFWNQQCFRRAMDSEAAGGGIGFETHKQLYGTRCF